MDNLHQTISKEWLFQIFKHEGRMIDTFVSSKVRQTNKNKFGFVLFSMKEESLNAMKRNDGLEIRGLKMKVSLSKNARNTKEDETTTGLDTKGGQIIQATRVAQGLKVL